MRRKLPWLLTGMLMPGLLAAPAAAFQFDYGTPGITSPLNIRRAQMLMRMSHRYNAATFPNDSAPALNLGLGLTKQVALDFVASTRNIPLDGELAVRYQLLDEYDDFPFALTTRLGYTTHRGGSGLAEVTASKNNLLPNLGAGIVGRYFTYVGDYTVNPGWMTAAGAGLSYALADGLSLVGDVVAPLDRSVIDAFGFNWSAGLQWWIPDTPHVMVLMLGRFGPGTSIGRTFSPDKDNLRVGFEYHAHFDAPFFPRRTLTLDTEED